MSFRKIIFWLHLVAGVGSGLVVLIMSATGVALAFEKEIIGWSERDLRRVPLPADRTSRIPLEELLVKVRELRPEGQPDSVTLYSDASSAVFVGFGRTNTFYANPYSGELRPQGSVGVREFMRVMIEWHRFLGTKGDQRATGKAITGACNLAFLILAVTGIYLWWPRQWSRNAVRAIVVFNSSLRGKARDWNWHNVIGIWTAPFLIVLTVTALPISYRWAGDLIYKVTGTEPPPSTAGPGARPGASGPAVEVPTPPVGAKPLVYQALLDVVEKEAPRWEQMTLRLGAPGGSGGGRAANPQGESSRTRPPDGGAERDREKARPEQSAKAPASPKAITVTVREAGSWPRTATTTFTLDPFAGTVLRREGFADFNCGRQARTWTRFLHTGEALGKGGQFVAGVASLGAVVLVWTGIALAFRRFFKRAPKVVPETSAL